MYCYVSFESNFIHRLYKDKNDQNEQGYVTNIKYLLDIFGN